MKNNKGFTLVELVVVVAILLLLATVAVVAVTGVLDQTDEDMIIVQDNEISRAVETYVASNCLEEGYCEISESDLSKYLSNTDKLNNITFPIYALSSANGVTYADSNSANSNSSLSAAILKNNTIKIDTPNFSSTATTNEGIYRDEDDDGYTYYFRGAVTNNYVKFAGKTWRIVRINGDGTIRLILHGNIAYKKFKSPDAGNAQYVGYTYNGTDSEIKTYLENTWYNSNLSDYDEYIAESTFCNDTITASTSGSFTYYGARERLKTNKTPSFKCNNTDKSYGGMYKLKIGLITADEVAFAGGKFSTTNSSYYLNLGYNYWTMSPYHSSSSSNNMFYVSSSGSLLNYSVSSSLYVVPVINLKYNTIITSGTGTSTDPYKV